MVFQNYALYPHLTVRENIAFALEVRRVPRKEILRRVSEAAQRLGLAELLERRPAQLSGGQRQRVALGRAIVRAPQAFLFDEPLSNLEAPLRSELRSEILKLHRALGATMIYVTHDQVEAMTMGQRIALLYEGRRRQLGTPAGAARVARGRPRRRQARQAALPLLRRVGSPARVTRALAFLAALAACGRAGAWDRLGQVRLEAVTGADYREARIERRVLEPYLAANPGIGVVERGAGTFPTGYRARILASLAAGSPPDVFRLDQDDVPALASRRVVLDLTPYLDRVGVDLDCFNPTALGIFTRGDAMLALPTGYTPIVVAYNKDLFDRAGIAYPGDAWTWDDFKRIAHRLTRDTDGDGRIDQWGAYFDRRLFASLPWIWSGGGDVLCPEGRWASGCLDAPRTIEAIRWYTRWVTADSIAPRPPSPGTPGGSDDVRLFYTGKLAMATAGHGWVPDLRAAVAQGRLRVGFVAIPHRAGSAPATAIYASAYAVPASVSRRRLAVELAAYLADTLAQALRGEAGLEVPALTPVAEALAARDTLGWEAAFLRAARHGRLPWSARVEQWPEVEAALSDLLDRIVLAQEDPEIAVHDAARQLDGLLTAAR